MQIVCPSCATSYTVSASSLGAAGRSVRCARCRTVWFAPASNEVPELVAELAAPAAVAQAGPMSVLSEGAERASTAVGADDRAGPGTTNGGAGEKPAMPAEGELAAVADSNLAADAAVGGEPPLIDPGARALGMDQHDPLAMHDSPPLAPAGQAPSPPGDAHEHRDVKPGEDVEGFVARRARREAVRRTRRVPKPRLATVILALLAVIGAILGWRSDVVRLMPQTASLFAAIGLPVNLRGLVFADVTITREIHDGVPVLMVDGKIANVARKPHDVPRIRLAMRNGEGREIYSWTTLPDRSMLAAGETLPFRTRLASPPAEGREVIIRFVNRRDTVAGIK